MRGPLDFSLPVSISSGSPPATGGMPRCLSPASASAGPLTRPAAQAEAGRPTEAGPRRPHSRPASLAPSPSPPDRPWPAAQRCPRGARHHPTHGIAPLGRRRSQGPAYSPQTQPRRAPAEKGEMREAAAGTAPHREQAPECLLRPRPAPTVALALRWRPGGQFLRQPGASSLARLSPPGRWKEHQEGKGAVGSLSLK